MVLFERGFNSVNFWVYKRTTWLMKIIWEYLAQTHKNDSMSIKGTETEKSFKVSMIIPKDILDETETEKIREFIEQQLGEKKTKKEE